MKTVAVKSSNWTSYRLTDVLFATAMGVIPLICVVELALVSGPEFTLFDFYLPIPFFVLSLMLCWFVTLRAGFPVFNSEIAGFIVLCLLTPLVRTLGLLVHFFLPGDFFENAKHFNLFGQIIAAFFLLTVLSRVFQICLNNQAKFRILGITSLVAIASVFRPALMEEPPHDAVGKISELYFKSEMLVYAWDKLFSSLWLIPFTLTLAFELLRSRQDKARGSDNGLSEKLLIHPTITWDRFRQATKPVMVVYVLIVFVSYFSYDGSCPGGWMDGSYDCSKVERLNVIFRRGYLFVPQSLCWALALLFPWKLGKGA